MTAQTLDLLLLLVAVDITVVAGRLCKKLGVCMCAEAVAYAADGTKQLHLRVRTGVVARDSRLNASVILQVSFLLRPAYVKPASDAL